MYHITYYCNADLNNIKRTDYANILNERNTSQEDNENQKDNQHKYCSNGLPNKIYNFYNIFDFHSLCPICIQRNQILLGLKILMYHLSRLLQKSLSGKCVQSSLLLQP